MTATKVSKRDELLAKEKALYDRAAQLYKEIAEVNDAIMAVGKELVEERNG